jgi:hypothetical protein
MKRALLFVPLFFSCGLIKFDVEQDLQPQTVQGNILAGPLGAFVAQPFPINIDVASEVQKRGTGPATKAQLKSLTFAIVPHNMPNGNFDFITEAHLFVEAPGLTKTELAKLAPVPRGQTNLSFDVVPNINLLPFINAGCTISATASGTQPTHDITFDGHIVVEVDI